MRVALVSCPAYGVMMPPLGIAMLAASLRHAGHTVSMHDLNIGFYNECKDKDLWLHRNQGLWRNEDSLLRILPIKRFHQWAKKIGRDRPDVVAFSLYTTNTLASCILAGYVRKAMPDAIMIGGGPNATRENSGAGLLGRGFDAVVIGEGEETLPDMLSISGKGVPLKVCPGYLSMSGGKVMDHGDRLPIKELDALPFADFSDLSIRDYTGDCIPVLASRGCIGACSFCDERRFWKTYRARSAENIFAELRLQKELTGISNFELVDNMINADLGFLERLSSQIIESKLKIRWCGRARISRMPFSLLSKMKAAGCVKLNFGIESGSDRILRLMRKNITVKDAEETIRDVTKAGILVSTNWMVGFPTETWQDFFMTLIFILRNRKYMDEVNFANITTIPEASAIRDEMKRYSIKKIIDEREWIGLDNSNRLAERRLRLGIINRMIKLMGMSEI
jgi:radical SAM superfamily enzyme YgiQ (UPF0313 family)